MSSPKLMFILGIPVIAIALLGPSLPEIEGRLHPATGGTVLTRVEPAGDGFSSRIWGRSTKPRDCAFLGLEWYIGDRDTGARELIVFEERSQDRPEGGFDFGPWVVRIPPDVLENGSRAYAVHRCHRLWSTVSVFYEPTQQ